MLSIKIALAENFLDYIFRPLGGINVASFYDTYWYAIDFILYLIVFLGAVRVSLEKRFTGRGGHALIIVLGIMLTIAMTWFAQTIGFRIANLWPVAAGLFIGLIAFLIFRLMSEQGAQLGKGVATAYVVTFLAVQAIMPQLCGPDGWIAQKMPIAWGIANILFLVAIVYMITELARFFSQGRNTEPTDDWPNRTGQPIVPTRPTTPTVPGPTPRTPTRRRRPVTAARPTTPTTRGPGPNPPPGSGTNPPPGSGTNPPPGSGTNPPPGPGTNQPPGSGTNPPPGPGTNQPPGSGTNPPPGSKPLPGLRPGVDNGDLIKKIEEVYTKIRHEIKKIRELTREITQINGKDWEKNPYVPKPSETLEILKKDRHILEKEIPQLLEVLRQLIREAQNKGVDAGTIKFYINFLRTVEEFIRRMLEWCRLAEGKCKGKGPGALTGASKILEAYVKPILALPSADHKLKEYRELCYYFIDKDDKLRKLGIRSNKAWEVYNQSGKDYESGRLDSAIKTVTVAVHLLDKLLAERRLALPAESEKAGLYKKLYKEYQEKDAIQRNKGYYSAKGVEFYKKADEWYNKGRLDEAIEYVKRALQAIDEKEKEIHLFKNQIKDYLSKVLENISEFEKTLNMYSAQVRSFKPDVVKIVDDLKNEIIKGAHDKPGNDIYWYISSIQGNKITSNNEARKPVPFKWFIWGINLKHKSILVFRKPIGLIDINQIKKVRSYPVGKGVLFFVDYVMQKVHFDELLVPTTVWNKIVEYERIQEYLIEFNMWKGLGLNDELIKNNQNYFARLHQEALGLLRTEEVAWALSKEEYDKTKKKVITTLMNSREQLELNWDPSKNLEPFLYDLQTLIEEYQKLYFETINPISESVKRFRQVLLDFVIKRIK